MLTMTIRRLLLGLSVCVGAIAVEGGGVMAQTRQPMPWSPAEPSLFSHIQNSILAETEAGATSVLPLPDDERARQAQGGLSYAAGAADGIFSMHTAMATDEATADEVLARLVDALARPQAMPAFYESIRSRQAISFVEGLALRIANDATLDHDRIHSLAIHIARHAPDREPVKAAIGILSVYSVTHESLEVYTIFGSHDEFALFAAAALSMTMENPQDSLWTIARRSTGWGRIQAVLRLVPTNAPQIRRWLLVDGFRNDILNEYLALTCAIEGGLLASLREDQPHPDILAGAGEIFLALTSDVPFGKFAEYPDGPEAAELYLAHMARDPDERAFSVAAQIKAYLSDNEAMLSKEPTGSTIRGRIVAAANAVLAQRH